MKRRMKQYKYNYRWSSNHTVRCEENKIKIIHKHYQANMLACIKWLDRTTKWSTQLDWFKLWEEGGSNLEDTIVIKEYCTKIWHTDLTLTSYTYTYFLQKFCSKYKNHFGPTWPSHDLVMWPIRLGHHYLWQSYQVKSVSNIL